MLLEAPADHEQRVPGALLDQGGVEPAQAGLRVERAAGQLGAGALDQRCHCPEERIGAQLVAGAVRGASLDPVLPPLGGAVHDGRRLGVAHLQRRALRRQDLAEVEPARHVDHVPVVQVGELERVPLHVVARLVAVAAHAVRVDGGLVPVDVQDRVAERGGAGRGERLGDAPRRESAFALDDVHFRGVAAIAVRQREREPERRGDADTRRAGRHFQERCRRRRVPVERLRLELHEQRRPAGRALAEAEQVLEPQLPAQVGGQQVRCGDARDLVAQRPERVQPERLVAGRVRDQVGVLAIRVRKVVAQGVEQQPLHEAARGDRAARVAGHRHVVVEQGAQRAVGQVEGFEILEDPRVDAVRLACEQVLRIDVHAAAVPETQRCRFHGSLLVPAVSSGAGPDGRMPRSRPRPAQRRGSAPCLP